MFFLFLVFVGQFLGSTAGPFLRPDHGSGSRRAQPLSRLAGGHRRRRREQGLAKAGNGRVRRALIQLAWRFLTHQKDSALAQWYRARTADGRAITRKVMIVALARKLLVAFWELVTTGKVPEGMKLHPAPVAG